MEFEEKKNRFFHCKSLYDEYIKCLFINPLDGGFNVIRCNPEAKKYKDCIMKTK